VSDDYTQVQIDRGSLVVATVSLIGTVIIAVCLSLAPGRHYNAAVMGGLVACLCLYIFYARAESAKQRRWYVPAACAFMVAVILFTAANPTTKVRSSHGEHSSASFVGRKSSW
jgi:hypothetical protein